MSAAAAERGQVRSGPGAVANLHRLRLLKWGVITLDIGILAIAASLGQIHLGGDWVSLAIWGVLIAAAGSLTVPTGGASLGLDLPLLLGAGLVFGPAAAGLLGLVAVFDAREFKREVSLSVSLYNRAEVSLSAMAGTAVYFAAGSHLGEWPWTALAGVLAVAVDAVVNYGLVASYWAIKSGKPFGSVVAGMRFGPAQSFIPIYACFGFVGVLVAEVYSGLGIAGVVACVAPVVLAWQAFTHRRLLDESIRSLEVKERLFRQFGQQIAIERKDERSILAGELHDEALPPIFQVHLMGQVIKQEFNAGRLDEMSGDVPKLLEAADEANSVVRGFVKDLRHSSLGVHGLFASLKTQVQKLESSGSPRIGLMLSDLDASERAQELVYVACREAMWNASKYSGAEWIRVGVEQVDHEVTVRVWDDGVGFDLDLVDSNAHFGLEMMTERVEAAGGHVAIESRPGSGTRLVATIPADA
jgi:signal transduction histidine kinase